MKNHSKIITIIVFAQFCCTTLWFASNAVVSQLIGSFNLENHALGHLTSAVNLGFIIGTLFYAIFNLADRYSPSKVFFISAVLGSAFNLTCILDSNTLFTLLSYRFLVGFFLAGIYPVGMKIAADYKEKGLGKALGFLVGALVLGTASPHLFSEFGDSFSWKFVFILTSVLAFFGGVLMIAFVPNGPYRKQIGEVDVKVCLTIFKSKELRKAAFGYFGHMWELFAFWTFVPIIIESFNKANSTADLNVSLLSFIIIALGGVASILAGYISLKRGVKNTALFALAVSCICCLLSPLVFMYQSQYVFVAFMCFWGMVVIADSPMFSTWVANSVSPNNKGTAMTIVNCVGFAISIVSIQLISILIDTLNTNYTYLILALGPILSLMYLIKLPQSKLR